MRGQREGNQKWSWADTWKTKCSLQCSLIGEIVSFLQLNLAKTPRASSEFFIYEVTTLKTWMETELGTLEWKALPFIALFLYHNHVFLYNLFLFIILKVKQMTFLSIRTIISARKFAFL